MKKIIISVLSGIALMLTTSCKDYLVVDHYDILPGDYMFQNETNVNAGLIGLYDTFYPQKEDTEEYDGSGWGFNSVMKLGSLPTLDVQAGGWDAAFNTQGWEQQGDTTGGGEFKIVWFFTYRAISRANVFLAGLEAMDNSMFVEGEIGKKKIEAQARFIRAFNYMILVKAFGRVPMLLTGESYSTSPSKPRPETDKETWDQIKTDMKYASDVLDWTPINNEYGRITKGAALGYLAEAYMWTNEYDTAKGIYSTIISDGPYDLLECYSYLFDVDTAWTKEDLFCTVMWGGGPGVDIQDNWGGWGPREDHYQVALRMTAGMEYGGWGSAFISWECYDSFELGDRRRDYSMVPVGKENPWTGQVIGATNPESNNNKISNGEFLPNISSTKYWRTPVSATGRNDMVSDRVAFRYLRFSHILLNYAECCFMTNDEPNGWDAVDKIRERAWGNMEVGVSDPEYPVALLSTTVDVPDAETYYTALKASKGYSVSAGILAVNTERRHEFNLEFSLYYDFKRTNFSSEHIDIEYPKGVGTPPPAGEVTLEHPAYHDKRTYRTFDNSVDKLRYFPIPYDEILYNDAIDPEDQNPGYTS